VDPRPLPKDVHRARNDLNTATRKLLGYLAESASETTGLGRAGRAALDLAQTTLDVRELVDLLAKGGDLPPICEAAIGCWRPGTLTVWDAEQAYDVQTGDGTMLCCERCRALLGLQEAQ